jgi:acetolactate synthase small subunit
VTLALILHDWRMLERIVGLTHRLGCSYKSVEVHARDDHLYHATIEFAGPPEQLRRLDTQLNRLLEDDKEMAR